jgi:glycosyltransferase involved in cell wall biosynthesis
MRLKILHTEASPGWGGQEIRILKESEGMRKRGHQVIIAPQKGGGLARYAREKGFDVIEIDYKKSRGLACIYKLYKILKEKGVDVLNTHSSLDSWMGGIAARMASVPIVRTRHLSTPVRKGLNSRLLYHRLADFVVTTCSTIIPGLSEQSGKPFNHFKSVPTGVDTKTIFFQENEPERFRDSLGLKPGDLLVGTACFMRSWKGIDDFLQAANLLRNFSSIKWVIIGGGHSEKYILKAKELELGGIVHFTGHLDKPFPAIAALDIFALLSTAHEGVSQASLQAGYLEKPMIATAVGGLAEVCIDQVTGIQVPSFAPGQVAKAVKFMQNNPEVRRKWGKSAKALVEERFTLQITLDQMEEIFASVCRPSLRDC